MINFDTFIAVILAKLFIAGEIINSSFNGCELSAIIKVQFSFSRDDNKLINYCSNAVNQASARIEFTTKSAGTMFAFNLLLI